MRTGEHGALDSDPLTVAAMRTTPASPERCARLDRADHLGPGSLAWHVECPDGSRYDVRPISPEDGEALRAFHRRLSERSAYLRFFRCHPELTDGEVERFTHVDHDARLALVVEEGGNLVAVGRFDREADTSTAEVAMVVADDHQARGIGSVLLDMLATAGRERGVIAFVAETLAENLGMLQVIRHSGFEVTARHDRECVTLEFPVAATRSYRVARAARWRQFALVRRVIAPLR